VRGSVTGVTFSNGVAPMAAHRSPDRTMARSLACGEAGTVTYSLVSATAVGFDLVRLPAGEQVAEVVLAALTSNPDVLARLADQHPGPARLARWQHVRAVGATEGVGATLGLALPALDLAFDGQAAASTAMLRRLELAPVGDLDALDHLLRHDALERTGTRDGGAEEHDQITTLAADVLVDAAASAYCAERLSPSLRRELAAPFVAARVQSDLGDLGAVAPLLDAFGATTAAGREAWRRAVDTCRAAANAWAPAMNEASWAVHLSSRTRHAAAAQLSTVAAFRRAGFTAADGARGVWNAVSGLVQAAVVEDLLDDDHYDTLVRPWRLVVGGRSAP
jgi:hypothetical protein